MRRDGEVFVGIDTASSWNAVALAQRGRQGKVRYLGESDNTASEWLAQDASKLALCVRLPVSWSKATIRRQVAVMTNDQWAALAHAFGKPEWLDNPRFATTELRDLNINDRLALIQSVLLPIGWRA